MTLNLSPKQLATLIAEAARATLEQAFASGCTAADVPDMSQALAGNAAQAIANLAYLDTSDA